MKKNILLLILLLFVITLCGCKTTKYKVTFNPNNGNDPIVVEYEEGSKIEYPTNVTNEGYMLKGWYDGNTPWNDHKKVTKDIVLTAKWVEYYSVTVKLNNGQEDKVYKIEKGNTLGTLPNPEPETKDYAFIGWFIGPEVYDPTKVYTEDIVINAVWLYAPNLTSKFKVTFELNNGEEPIERFFYKGSVITMDFIAKKEGYTLDGWYYNGKLWNFSDPVKENMTLVAVWVENK